MPLALVLLGELRSAAMAGMVVISTALAFGAGMTQLQYLSGCYSVNGSSFVWPVYAAMIYTWSLPPCEFDYVDGLCGSVSCTSRCGIVGDEFDEVNSGGCKLLEGPAYERPLRCTLHVRLDSSVASGDVYGTRSEEVDQNSDDTCDVHVVQTIPLDRPKFGSRQPIMLVDSLDDELVVSEFLDFIGEGVTDGGSTSVSSYPSLRGFVQEYREAEINPGVSSPFHLWTWTWWMMWTWSSLWPLMWMASSCINVMVICTYVVSVLNSVLPSSGGLAMERGELWNNKRSSESCDPAAPMCKRIKLGHAESDDRCAPQGWVHDLTQDGDVEPNPGPPRLNAHFNQRATLEDYLAWVTGGLPDHCWAADGAPVFVAMARWSATLANAGQRQADVLIEAQGLCTANEHARARFSFLWTADPCHPRFNELIAFYRWMLGLCRHIHMLEVNATGVEQLFIPLPANTAQQVVCDVVVPVIAALGAQLQEWHYNAEEGGAQLTLRSWRQGQQQMEPAAVCLTVAQLRCCLHALSEVAVQREFVVLDFVLDLSNGQCICEEGTLGIIRALQARMREWNIHEHGVAQPQLHLSYVMIVPAMGAGICVITGPRVKVTVGSKVVQESFETLVAQPSGSTQEGDLGRSIHLIFPWMLGRYVTAQGLELLHAQAQDDQHSVDTVGDTGNREMQSEMESQILPAGTKRKRQFTWWYYLDMQPRTLSLDSTITDPLEVQGLILGYHGLHSSWASCVWRDDVLYVGLAGPAPTKEQIAEVFALAEDIMSWEKPVYRLGSQTIVLGLRASGPRGPNVAAQRHSAFVRKLNIMLRRQIPTATWTSIALVRHGDIPEHIDSLDEASAFMLSRPGAGRDAFCRICITETQAELHTIGKWCAFNPLLLHSVRAAPGTISIVLYSASRGVHPTDEDFMRELGFPGWEHTAQVEDNVADLAEGAGAQTFTFTQRSAVAPTPQSTPRVRGTAASSGVNESGPVEISPTLPYSGGLAGAEVATHTPFDPDIPGECVFQCMLWLAGYETSLPWCRWARAVAAQAWLVQRWDPLSTLNSTLNARFRFLFDRSVWIDPEETPRWGCILDILLLACEWNLSIAVEWD
eukprot:2331247-Amphidinium_carterae.1